MIPTRDRARWVVEAVESALAQTAEGGEVIVVDDGSTDDTGERLRAYAPRLRYLRQEPAGAAAAKNRGIAAARGAWVGFLDSDDRWAPALVATAERAVAGRPEVGLVAFRAREVDAAGRPTAREVGKRSPGERFSTASLLGEDAGGCSWFFVRRELLERVGGFDESLDSAEECDLALRLSLLTELIGVSEPLVLRRIHAGMLSRDVLRNARCWIRLLEKLARERPDAVRRERGPWHRALGKERLRLGRELLAHGGPAAWPEARRQLAAALRLHPAFLRGWVYLAWSFLAPGGFARWRRWELRRRGAA